MSRLGVFIYHGLLFFALLGVLFVPFSFRNWHFQSAITKFIFEDIIVLTASQFKGITVANPEISSDSTTLYLLFFILFIVAIIGNTLFSFFRFWKTYENSIFKIIQLILTYYLVVIMLTYGFDKIFKAQFYLPEPNTLYTPLGMLDKDILYWSTIGTSYAYNVLMGLAEVIPALLMMYHKTRNPGLFILSGVLINVVLINFGFDISVKLFSSFLLFTSLLLLAPSFKKMLHFFVLNKATSLPYLTGKDLIGSNFIRLPLKAVIILFIFMESLLPYIKSGQYNDDNVPRNYLHGAYGITAIETSKTQENRKHLNLKRFFIHRHNYFILQYEDDTMEDFRLDIHQAQNQFILTDYEGETIVLDYSYSETSNVLEIKSVELDWVISAASLPWRDLPLMQPLFHWTVDEI